MPKKNSKSISLQRIADANLKFGKNSGSNYRAAVIQGALVVGVFAIVLDVVILAKESLAYFLSNGRAVNFLFLVKLLGFGVWGFNIASKIHVSKGTRVKVKIVKSNMVFKHTSPAYAGCVGRPILGRPPTRC